MIEKEIENDKNFPRKISKKTFKQKYTDIKSKHLKIIKDIKLKKNNELKENEKNSQKKIIRKKYKLLYKSEISRYSLVYNSLKNEELYRKGVLASKISKLKTNYHHKKQTELFFDDKLEKAKLKSKIQKLVDKYSLPVSYSYRKKRTSKDQNQKLHFAKVPLNTPLRKNVKTLLLLLFAALLSTISLDVFIKPFGIYNAGLRGITQSFYYLYVYYSPSAPTWFSYLMFLILNIPLAIFGFKVMGKKFTIFTIIFLFSQYLFSTILVETNFYDHIKPFGKNETEIREFINNTKNSNDLFRYSIPIISSIMGAIFYGISLGLIYKAGGSNGGSKFIVSWLSLKKDISIGKLSLLLSIFVISFGIILNKIIIEGNNFMSSFTSITFFSTISFVIMSNNVLDFVFSKSKKEIITVITNKKQALLRFLDVKLMYSRTFSVSKVKTSFSEHPKHKIEFLVSSNEARQLIKIFGQLDPSALITSTQVIKSYGRFYSRWFE